MQEFITKKMKKLLIILLLFGLISCSRDVTKGGRLIWKNSWSEKHKNKVLKYEYRRMEEEVKKLKNQRDSIEKQCSCFVFYEV